MQASTIATSLRDYLRILFHRKWYIIAFTLSSLVGFAVYAWGVAPVIYEAGNDMLVHDRNKEPLRPDEKVSPVRMRLNQVFDRIQSTDGVEEVLAGIHALVGQFHRSPRFLELRERYLQERQAYTESEIEKAEAAILSTSNKLKAIEEGLLPEVGRGEIRDQSLIAQARRRKGLQQLTWVEHDLAQVSKWSAGIGRVPGSTTVSMDPVAQRQDRQFLKLVREVKLELRISMRGAKIHVGARSGNKKLARLIVDRVIEQVEMVHKRVVDEEVYRNSAMVDWQITQSQGELRSARQELIDFDRKYYFLERRSGLQTVVGAVNNAVATTVEIPTGPNSGLHALNRLNHLRAQEAQIVADIEGKQGETDVLKTTLAQTPEETTTHEHQESVFKSKMEEILSALVNQESEWATRASDEHPELKRVRRRIRFIETKLEQINRGGIHSTRTIPNPKYDELASQVAQAEADLAGLRGRLNSVRMELEHQVTIVKDLPELEARRENLLRGIAEKQNYLGGLSKKHQDAIRTQEIHKAGGGVEFSKPEHTELPRAPAEPKVALLMFMGLIIGLFFSAAAVFFVEYADHSIKGIEDVRRFLGLPVLGVIPDYEMYQNNSKQRLLRLLGSTTPRRLLTLALGTTVLMGLVWFVATRRNSHPGISAPLYEDDAREKGLTLPPGFTEPVARKLKTDPQDLSQRPKVSLPSASESSESAVRVAQLEPQKPTTPNSSNPVHTVSADELAPPPMVSAE